MKLFHATGSRVYGIPRADSDYDILVDGSVVPYQWLEAKGFWYKPKTDSATNTTFPDDGLRNYYMSQPDGVVINAIWIGTQEILNQRLEARRLCLQEGPVTRSTAVKIHRQVEKEGPVTFTGLAAEAWRITAGVA